MEAQKTIRMVDGSAKNGQCHNVTIILCNCVYHASTRHNSADSVPTSNLASVEEVAIKTTFSDMIGFAGNLLHLQLSY